MQIIVDTVTVFDAKVVSDGAGDHSAYPFGMESSDSYYRWDGDTSVTVRATRVGTFANASSFVKLSSCYVIEWE